MRVGLGWRWVIDFLLHKKWIFGVFYTAKLVDESASERRHWRLSLRPLGCSGERNPPHGGEVFLAGNYRIFYSETQEDLGLGTTLKNEC